MSELATVKPPDGWSVGSLNTHSAVYRNRVRGLEVAVRPVRKGTRVHSRAGDPTHYVVQLTQDWFATGVHGDRKMSAKAGSAAEAAEIAASFMQEFVEELERARADEGATADAAEREVEAGHLTSELAAEALADAAGYSDGLLESVIEAETGVKAQFIAHREGTTVETVSGAVPAGLEVSEIHRVFPVDADGLQGVLDESFPITTVVHLTAGTVYRFVFSPRRETTVLLPPGTRVASPTFEHAVCNVLEEKW